MRKLIVLSFACLGTFVNANLMAQTVNDIQTNNDVNAVANIGNVIANLNGGSINRGIDNYAGLPRNNDGKDIINVGKIVQGNGYDIPNMKQTINTI